MMGFGDYVGRNMPSERPFGLKRCFTAGGQPDAVAYAKHVCIYSHTCFIPDHRQHHIRSFTAYAREGQQVVYVGWYFSAEFVYQPTGHADKRECLVVGI